MGPPRTLLWSDRIRSGPRRDGASSPAPPRDFRRHRDLSGGNTMTLTRPRVRGAIGESIERPDGAPKVKGEFQYASDLWREGMLHGATLRGPHPHARIVSIDATAALAIAGVRAVL